MNLLRNQVVSCALVCTWVLACTISEPGISLGAKRYPFSEHTYVELSAKYRTLKGPETDEAAFGKGRTNSYFERHADYLRFAALEGANPTPQNIWGEVLKVTNGGSRVLLKESGSNAMVSIYLPQIWSNYVYAKKTLKGGKDQTKEYTLENMQRYKIKEGDFIQVPCSNKIEYRSELESGKGEEFLIAGPFVLILENSSYDLDNTEIIFLAKVDTDPSVLKDKSIFKFNSGNLLSKGRRVFDPDIGKLSILRSNVECLEEDLRKGKKIILPRPFEYVLGFYDHYDGVIPFHDTHVITKVYLNRAIFTGATV